MKANINHNAYNSNPKVRDAHQVKLKRDDCRPEMKTIMIILKCCHLQSFYCWYFWRNTNWSLVKVLSLVGIAQTQHLHWGQPDLPLTFAWIQKKIFITLLRGCIAQNWSLQSCQACHVEQCLSTVEKNRTDNTWVVPLWQTATPPMCSNLGFLPEPRIELFDRRKSSTAFCFFSVGSALLYLRFLVLMLSEWKGWPCLPSLKYKKLPRDK